MASSYQFGPVIESTSIVSIHAGSRLGARGFSRSVSLSVVRPELAREREFGRHFVEASTRLAAIADPCVLPIEHVLEEHGRLFAVSPEVKGGTLARLLNRHPARAKPLSADVAYGLVLAVAGAVGRVSATMGHGAVLGGLSADTVWLTDRGETMLMPTALCASKAPARCRGLAVSRYRAPELDRNKAVGPAADVYSLALLLWDLVSLGRAPTPHDLDGATRVAPSGIDARVIHLTMRCLSPSPDDRVQSPSSFGTELAKRIRGGSADAAVSSRPRANGSSCSTRVQHHDVDDTMVVRTVDLEWVSPRAVHDVAKPPMRHIAEIGKGARPRVPRPLPRRMAPKNAPSRPDPRLSGPSGLRLLLDGGAARWVVGRGPSADLVVHDPDMSREHFEVVRARDGSFRISDLESKNGIFLNGSRARSFAIEPGDEVQAGGTVLRFEV